MLETLANCRHQQLGSQERLMHRLAARPREVETLEHPTTASMADQLGWHNTVSSSTVTKDSISRKHHGALSKLRLRSSRTNGPPIYLEPSPPIEQGTK